MSWTILPLSKRGLPNLLVRSRFDKDGYSVQLTDLSCVWSEILTKHEIIQRVSESGSNIDPSEDDQQFKIFLDKVESALNCENGTSFVVNNTEDADLVLELEAPLPHPLPRFKWNIQLQQQRADQLEKELVQPLIAYASSLQRKIQQLIDQLHDKDRVISKICDRLETSGNDLTTVFPGASNIKMSRKKAQREQLAAHVKGLGDFDEASWKGQNEFMSDDVALNAEMTNDVFAGLPSGIRFSDPEEVELRRHWLERLSASHGVAIHEGSAAAMERADRRIDINGGKYGSNSHVNHDVDDKQVDEFQRQNTPPQHKRHLSVQSEDGISDYGKAPAPAEPNDQADEDSTTDDEDDLDAPPPKSRPTPKVKVADKPAPAPSTKLGTIGGQIPQAQRTAAAEPYNENGDAAAEKPRAKLGAIGGKSAQSGTADDHSRKLNDATRTSSETQKPKLGAIGGKKANSSAETTTVDDPPTHKDLPSREAKVWNDTKSPEPQETAEDIADRKRDQLKRDLEQKAKMPVKKKRKF